MKFIAQVPPTSFTFLPLVAFRASFEESNGQLSRSELLEFVFDLLFGTVDPGLVAACFGPSLPGSQNFRATSYAQSLKDTSSDTVAEDIALLQILLAGAPLRMSDSIDCFHFSSFVSAWEDSLNDNTMSKTANTSFHAMQNYVLSAYYARKI